MWTNNIANKEGGNNKLNLGIEYLVRSDLIKQFIEFPCSLFVENDEFKVVVTINKSRNKSKFCVRNWFISNCKKEQPIPFVKEYMVDKDKLFEHSAIILQGFSLVDFRCSFSEWSRNRGNGGHPMPDYIYKNYFDNQLSPLENSMNKEMYLWNCFTKIYVPSIARLVEAIGNVGFYSTELNLSFEEQKLIEEHFKNIWNYWLKWKKYMLFPTIPGELIFMKEYQ